MNGVNDELMLDVLAQIEREPERWGQAVWVDACGTARCFAGWACALGNVKLVRAYVNGEREWVSEETRNHVSDVATELLGLTHRQTGGGWPGRGTLFYHSNTLDQLYALVSEYTGMAEDVVRDKVRERI